MKTCADLIARWKSVTAFLASAGLTATWIVRPMVMKVYAIISLAIGHAMVLGHNVWSGGALTDGRHRCFDPLEGPAAVNSDTASADSSKGGHYGDHIYLYVLPTLVLGLYLTWAGFTARGLSPSR